MDDELSSFPGAVFRYLLCALYAVLLRENYVMKFAKPSIDSENISGNGKKRSKKLN
jgi:hypothetical protein